MFLGFFFSFLSLLSFTFCSHGFSLHLLSGGKKHVTALSDPVPGLSSGCSGDPSSRTADQGERPRAHRCRGAHVHQQPGDPHQVPRLKVRREPTSPAALSVCLSVCRALVSWLKQLIQNDLIKSKKIPFWRKKVGKNERVIVFSFKCDAKIDNLPLKKMETFSK